MRYIIGIDLGTTNCALSFVDLEQPFLPPQLFSIPQLIAENKVSNRSTLPSFCYLINQNEWPPDSLQLPWKKEVNHFVGEFAKIQGGRVPTRLVKSAKSWLCHVAANRRDKILPLECADFTQRMSPVEATACYLAHLRDAWNSVMAKGNPLFELEEQEVVLTVPASFDEVARSLTIEASRQAGFLHVTLLEEPQAAFYSWLSQHEAEWKSIFKKGDSILICDVGGGTTDFSLIEIHENLNELSFQRMSVGDHLLLGGDNIDIALAHYLEQKIAQQGYKILETPQWLQLLLEARSAKEKLLRADVNPYESYDVVIQGAGSSVVKGSIKVSIIQNEIQNYLLQGFFPQVCWDEALQLNKTKGFRTKGLPYEDEPAITKHLACFLKQAQRSESIEGVDYILFNGGTLKPLIFQKAIVNALMQWFPQKKVKCLESFNLDLAVARGAAYYGKVRRGLGVAIGGGIPRTYYLKIDTIHPTTNEIQIKALTLLPRGTKEGSIYHSSEIFSLRQNVPVVFNLLTSHVRLKDQAGDLIEIDPLEMHPLPPIQTILRFGKKQIENDSLIPIPVRLSARLNEIGTIELWLESQKSEHKWNLEFQLRSASGQETLSSIANDVSFSSANEMFAEGALEKAKEIITQIFQPNTDLKPNQVMEMLEKEIEIPRKMWSPSLLRELWIPLLKVSDKRKLSLKHEVRWWNLAGFFLRPGFGYALDDFRIKELWKILLADLKNPKTLDCQIQMWICFRRIAGGFNKGQQIQLAAEFLGNLFDKQSDKIVIKRSTDLYSYSEKIRFLASFERLDLSQKIRLGNAVLNRLIEGSNEFCDYWALSRIGARHLLYGSAGQVVPRDICVKWVESYLKNRINDENNQSAIFMMRQLGRKIGHRELNLPVGVIHEILKAYPKSDLSDWLLHEKELSLSEQDQIFGDQLPTGLILKT